MADWTREIVTPPKRVRYKVANPTCWNQIQQMLHAATADVKVAGREISDDVIIVRADEDFIYVEFEER